MGSGESAGRITPEGVLKPNLERKGVALYCGVLKEKLSGESTTSNATLFLSAGVLVLASIFRTAVFLPDMGDSAVLVKADGDSIDLSGVDAFICWAIWVKQISNQIQRCIIHCTCTSRIAVRLYVPQSYSSVNSSNAHPSTLVL